jgi:hypothetical protein
MSNIYLPHLLVIPEDDANREILLGFLNHRLVDSRRIQLADVAGGWGKAITNFLEDHVPPMRKFTARHVLILIDLDGRSNRLADERTKIPDDLQDRVFLMGCQSTPEKLSGALKMSREKIGEALAEGCAGNDEAIWNSPMLAHNVPELERMRRTICGQLLRSDR